MKGEKKTTLWLDILTYILIPLVVIIGGYQLIGTILTGDVVGGRAWLFVFFEAAFLLLHIYTVYHVYQRNRSAYFLLRFLIVATAIRAAIEYANTRNANTDQNFLLIFLGYLAVCAVFWVYPNEIYFRARKHLFLGKNAVKVEEEIEAEDVEISEDAETVEEKETRDRLIEMGVPDSLLDYVYIADGAVHGKQKLPKELEAEYEEYKASIKEENTEEDS